MVRMSVKTWVIAIVLVLAGGANAGLVFSLMNSKYAAALVAGAGFVAVGVFLVGLVWSHAEPYMW